LNAGYLGVIDHLHGMLRLAEFCCV